MNTKVIFAFLEKIRQKYSSEDPEFFDKTLAEQMV